MTASSLPATEGLMLTLHVEGPKHIAGDNVIAGAIVGGGMALGILSRRMAHDHETSGGISRVVKTAFDTASIGASALAASHFPKTFEDNRYDPV